MFKNYDNKNDFFVYVFRANEYKGELIELSDEGSPIWVPDSKMGKINPRECDSFLWKLVSEEGKFSVVFRHKGERVDWENSLVAGFYHKDCFVFYG